MIEATIIKEDDFTPVIEYPVLMVHNNDMDRDDPLVVLFTSPIGGMVVSENTHIGDLMHSIGDTFNGPHKTWFSKYYRTVCLRNKS